MGGGCTVLDSETLHWLIFCDWAVSVHWGLALCCSLECEVRSLTPFYLLTTLDSAVPSLLEGHIVSGRLSCRLPPLVVLGTTGALRKLKPTVSYLPYTSKVALGISGQWILKLAKWLIEDSDNTTNHDTTLTEASEESKADFCVCWLVC